MTKETGTLIQKLRLQHGWSQEDLAALSTLSVRTIQRLERGHTASMESLKALASVFEIDFATLREPEMATPSTLPNTPTVDTQETLALAHVRRIKSFYRHVLQFAVVIGVLAVVNYTTDPHYPWVLWVVVAWGSGLLMHGLRAFDKLLFLTASWEKRQVEKYIRAPALGRRL